MICAECGAEAREHARGWRAYRVEGSGEESELVFYCPTCAEREFDWVEEDE